MWADFTNHFGVSDLVPSGSRNIRVLDGAEGIRAVDVLLARAHGMLTDSLGEAAEFVFVLWVAAELAVFKHLAGVLVQDW